jgi:TetR/AcrR family transcriptional repressor of mexJK operon
MSALLEIDLSDSRARLIQAAAEVFVEEGYQASVERIAGRAGVARQTLYNHFPCKADLFREVVSQATAALLITLDADRISLRERLLRFGGMYPQQAPERRRSGLLPHPGRRDRALS